MSDTSLLVLRNKSHHWRVEEQIRKGPVLNASCCTARAISLQTTHTRLSCTLTDGHTPILLTRLNIISDNCRFNIIQGKGATPAHIVCAGGGAQSYGRHETFDDSSGGGVWWKIGNPCEGRREARRATSAMTMRTNCAE